MTNKDQTQVLNETILYMQNKQATELYLLKEQFHITLESLKPINLLKSTVKKSTESPEIKTNIVNNVIGLTTGYLSKLVLFGASRNPIARMLGTVFQFAVTNFASKNGTSIQTAGENILHRILQSKKRSSQNHQSTLSSNDE